MEIDINHINNELNIIINNKKHTHKIILYALAALELISIIQNTHIIPLKFIKIMEYLKSYMDCYIDFDLLLYIHENKKKVVLNQDFESSNIFDRIDDMLREDAEILNTFIGDINKDEYGTIDENVIRITKKLFNIIDNDKDGYIGALDILNLIEICNKYILVFENNFIDALVQILVIRKRIDYYLFLENLF